MEFLTAIQAYAEQPLPRHVLLDLLKGYKRPNDKLSELVSQGLLTRVKREIYTPGSKLPIAQPGPYLLANHLTGPSYVSMETALSYWGLIPERVYEISSVTTGLSKTYKTVAGRFSYIHLPLPYFSFGIKKVEITKKQTVLIASPEKALCDKIITTAGLLIRSEKQAFELLTEDLRIEIQALQDLNVPEINKWIKDAPKKSSLSVLVKTLKKI